MTRLPRFRTTLALTAALLAVPALIQPAAAQVDRAEVEQIIEEYIMNNPETILESVNEYQTTGRVKEQGEAISRNERKIFQHSLSPVAGDPNGDITVVEFFDYNCGYCKRVVDDVHKLTEDGHNIKVIYKDFPILGPTSETASQWALAAHNQGKYVPFHNKLMESSGRIDEAQLVSIAEGLDLDVEKLRSDAQSEKIQTYLDETRALAQELGITGTPGFIIKDEVFPGAIEYDSMMEIINEKRAENDTE